MLIYNKSRQKYHFIIENQFNGIPGFSYVKKR